MVYTNHTNHIIIIPNNWVAKMMVDRLCGTYESFINIPTMIDANHRNHIFSMIDALRV